MAKKLICVFLFLSFAMRSQDTLNKGVRDGWAIHLGAGYMYGGNLGVLGERQILLKKKLRISPFVAFGVAEGGTDSLEQTYFWIAMSVGANMEYGKKHRLIFGPHFELQRVIGNSVDVKKSLLPSGAFIIGYKGTADFGLIWQVYIGDVYIQDYTTESKQFTHNSHFGLGIGYKF